MPPVFCLVLLLAYCLSCHAHTPIQYTACESNPPWNLTLTRLVGEPWPPQATKKLAIEFEGTLNKVVTGGTYSADIFIHNIPVTSLTGNICDILQCPLSGTVSESLELDVPNIQAPLKLVARAVDQDSKVTLCVTVETTIAPPPPTPTHAAQIDHLHPSLHKRTRTMIEYSRAINTCDANDRPVPDGTTRLVYAMTTEPPKNGVIVKHDVRGRNYVNFYRAPQQYVLGEATSAVQMDMAGIARITSSTQTLSFCRSHTFSHFNDLHVVRIEPLVLETRRATTQFMAMYLCGKGLRPRSFHGECDSTAGTDFENCMNDGHLLAVWGQGGDAFTLPPEAGILLPASASVVLQVVYTNPFQETFQDRSGFRLVVTPSLRAFHAGWMATGRATDSISIPVSSSAHVDGFCPSECTSQLLPAHGVRVVGGFVHAHSAARQVSARHIANKTEVSVMNTDLFFQTEFQSYTSMDPVTLMPGDALSLKCTYDTSDRLGPTTGGLAARHEACMNYLLYYPKQTNITSCTSGSSASAVCGKAGSTPAQPPVVKQSLADPGLAPCGAVPSPSPQPVALSASPLNASKYTHSKVLSTFDNGVPSLTMYWNLDRVSSRIHIALDAIVGGWVGVGIADPGTGAMIGSDVMLAWAERGNLSWSDRHIECHCVPSIDANQSFFDVKGYQTTIIVPDASNDDSGGMSPARLAAIVLGALVLIVAVAAAFLMFRRVHAERKTAVAEEQVELRTTSDMDSEHHGSEGFAAVR